jgi:hypothetical protein
MADADKPETASPTEKKPESTSTLENDLTKYKVGYVKTMICLPI